MSMTRAMMDIVIDSVIVKDGRPCYYPVTEFNLPKHLFFFDSCAELKEYLEDLYIVQGAIKYCNLRLVEVPFETDALGLLADRPNGQVRHLGWCYNTPSSVFKESDDAEA